MNYPEPPAISHFLANYQFLDKELAEMLTSINGEQFTSIEQEWPLDKYIYVFMGFDADRTKKALDSIDKQAVVIILDANVFSVKYALDKYDFSQNLAVSRLILITDSDKEGIYKALLPIQDRLCRSVHVGIVESTDNEDQYAFWNKVLSELCNYADSQRTGILTQMKNSRVTCNNLLENICEYHTYPGINELKDRFKDQPVLLVAGGPSIDKQLEQIKQIYDDGTAIIISCLTMLKPLMDNDIIPDIVTALDYHEISAKFFEGLSYIDTQFIFDPKVNHAVVAKAHEHNNRIMFLGSDWLDSILQEDTNNKDKIISGGTVAHFNFSLAEYMGCSPIIMVGQDLAFSEGKYYPDCVLESHPWKKETTPDLLSRPGLREGIDVHGNSIKYDEQFQCYHANFEIMWATSDALVLDCTEGGLPKQYAKAIPLKETIITFLTEYIGDLSYPYKLVFGQATEMLEVELALTRTKGGIEVLIGQYAHCLRMYAKFEAAEYSDEMRSEVRPGIVKAGKIIMESPYTHLIDYYSGIADRIKLWNDSDLIMHKDLESSEKLILQVKRDRELMKTMKQAASEAMRTIEKVLNNG